MPSSHATSTRSLLLLIGPFSSSLHPYPYPRYDMKQIFGQFDADGDGKLDIYEIARAFRAMGLPKRDGTKMEMDKATFKSFDVNGERARHQPPPPRLMRSC